MPVFSIVRQIASACARAATAKAWDSSASFPPIDISGLTLWLDASDISTLYQDAAKTTPVASDGDPVGAWDDQSSTGCDVIQATPADKLVYKTNIFGTLSGIYGDATTDFLGNETAGIPTGTSARTLFVVYKPIAITGVNSYVHQGTTSTAGDWFTIEVRTSLVKGDPYFSGYSADLTDGSSPTTAAKIATMVFDGANGTLYRNGSQIDTGALALDTTGDRLFIGRSAIITEYMDGYVGCVIMYNTALSTEDRSAVEAFLSSKWGITI